ncbi:MAG: hypothetical protein ACOY15_13595 [Pseudomonadota bacterium]
MQLEALLNFWNSLFADISLTSGWMDWPIQLLHAPLTAIIAAELLLFLAVIGLVWFVSRRIWPAHRLILMASKAVEGTADPAAFTASFPRFDRAIHETPLLRRAWGKFRAGIIVPPQSARAAVRHNLRAGDYLHLEALEAGGFNFRFFKSWSAFFFGAGIFLTLLGVTADIHLASQAALTDATAWGAMLAGLANKTLPLLAGAGAGLTLAATFHWAEQRLRSDLLRLSQVLEERIQFSLARPAAEQQQYLQLTGTVGAAAAVQTSLLPEQLRILSQEIVAALARVETQMTQTMPGRIGDAMQPLSEALDMLGKRLSDSNAEALRQAVGELSQGLHARAAEDLDALSDALAQARGGLEDAGHLLRDASTHASEKLNNAGEALAEQMGRASQHAQQAFGPLPARVAEFGAALEQFNEGLSRHGDAVAAAAQTTQRAIGVMDEIMARPREYAPAPAHPAIMQPQTRATDFMMIEDLARAARDMSASVETVLDARRLLKQLSSHLREPATALITEDWGKHRNALTDSDDVLNDVLENFREGASQQRAGLNAAIEELENRLERLFRNLDTGASRLDSAIQTIQRNSLIAPSAASAPLGGTESNDAA